MKCYFHKIKYFVTGKLQWKGKGHQQKTGWQSIGKKYTAIQNYLSTEGEREVRGQGDHRKES